MHGEWIEGQTNISNEVVNHFNSVYTASNTSYVEYFMSAIPNTVNDEMNRAFTVDVSIVDIHDAVFSLGSSKAPGPDRWNGAFSK